MVQYTLRDEIDYAKRIIERDNRDIDVSWALKLGKESEDSKNSHSKPSRYGMRDVIPISFHDSSPTSSSGIKLITWEYNQNT